MQENKPFVFKPWMLISFAVAVLLLVFNFDPIGDTLKNIFGQGADKWAINIVLIALIVYTFIKKK